MPKPITPRSSAFVATGLIQDKATQSAVRSLALNWWQVKGRDVLRGESIGAGDTSAPQVPRESYTELRAAVRNLAERLSALEMARVTELTVQVQALQARLDAVETWVNEFTKETPAQALQRFISGLVFYLGGVQETLEEVVALGTPEIVALPEWAELQAELDALQHDVADTTDAVNALLAQARALTDNHLEEDYIALSDTAHTLQDRVIELDAYSDDLHMRALALEVPPEEAEEEEP